MLENCPDDAVAVVLSGEIDLDNADVITAGVADALATSPASIWLDLRAVTFIDSSGLSAIMRAHLSCKGHGVGLIISNPSPPVLRLLRITALDAVFDVRPAHVVDLGSEPGHEPVAG